MPAQRTQPGKFTGKVEKAESLPWTLDKINHINSDMDHNLMHMNVDENDAETMPSSVASPSDRTPSITASSTSSRMSSGSEKIINLELVHPKLCDGKPIIKTPPGQRKAAEEKAAEEKAVEKTPIQKKAAEKKAVKESNSGPEIDEAAAASQFANNMGMEHVAKYIGFTDSAQGPGMWALVGLLDYVNPAIEFANANANRSYQASNQQAPNQQVPNQQVSNQSGSNQQVPSHQASPYHQLPNSRVPNQYPAARSQMPASGFHGSSNMNIDASHAAAASQNHFPRDPGHLGQRLPDQGYLQPHSDYAFGDFY
ncbi:MAG: hypothetical protein Q9191_007280 [Dirinaria sp. TL-2023a]